jgi:serine/threonine-protein kinase
MPFVEGESLRDRLTREKQLPIADAVRLATQVAGALDYAHRHGVIHRDIKPENVMLHDGSALVADFGIALAVSSAGGGSRMTETGMSLGTPHYMSPEQAMGEREITARSDVYALGAMTYEMLVGEPPFTGPTAQAIVAKVMTAEPAGLTAQRRSVPPAVEDAVLTALAKLPADRFATAAEFSMALTAPATATRRSAAVGAGRYRFGWGAGATMGVLAFALGLLAAKLVWRDPAPPFSPGVLRYAMSLPDSAPLADQNGSGLAYAPDGSVFAYTSRLGLMLRAGDRLDVVPVAAARRGGSPFFSPDGRWLGFMDGARVMKVPLDGGAPVTIDDLWWIAADGSGRPDSLLVANGNRSAGTVTPDGRALVFQEESSDRNGIRSMVFDSAPASRLVVRGTFGESAPALSAEGKWLAYQSDETGRMEVYVRPYPGPGARVPVSLHGGTEPVWAHSGRELFFRSGDSLMAAAVTLSPTFAVTGRRPLFTGSFVHGDTYREYDVAPDSRHFIMLSGGAGRSTLIGLQHVFDRLRGD